MKRAVKVGRPKVPKRLAKGSLLSVRFSEDERKDIERAAARDGQQLSGWARAVLLAASNRQNIKN
jgi:hypothetical protein